MFLRYCLLFFAAIALPMAASPDAEQSGQQTVVSAQEGHKAEAHDGDHAATEPEEAVFNPNEMIMHHIADSHGWHIMDWNDKEIGIPLPVILWTREGLVVFSSSLFHHDIEGRHVAEAGGQRFINLHEKIYYASDAPNEHGVYAQADAATHEVANAKPWDISITKNVASLLVSVVIILVLFIGAARSYAKNGAAAPRGLAGFVEPLVVFVRDDIAKNNIGPHYKKFVPLLLTIFFFIWVNNLMGLVPFFPGGANVTGNIAVTMVLAFVAFVVTNVNGNRHYWKHILWMPGLPVAVKPLLAIVEIIGIFTKPFSLMIRLFANITAGHIIVLSLVSLVFIFETVWVSPVSVLLTLFISVLELLVAALQAYIFTLLTALYLGAALQEEHH
ncbi:MAG: ATP synthase F0 subunit A [Cryomorphaceae bacterium BACL18 MAG-120924-bin36]|jgi:F-type H+-transporting ATPase subunit a|nr:MAG: ATP synthase F0 subunit A [Cryomorphaceae bacterium BACL18 MAG-120924-bin36]KRP06395.1 MAG: ATP synthase F0 subunit A [Cryomorphaceae bacterium BACL18 MAG-120507-bin74]MDP4578250.1 F0F1 ATP synthase subunit A [Schleiferiaceae bacterium]MDP4628933.1 F0F1 ATP synthase subunit A [Schleiferiaceae bacterium]MDP5014475.1 F0F1 ATP synthase subunit A [Schleiferiaceae bacterium]